MQFKYWFRLILLSLMLIAVILPCSSLAQDESLPWSKPEKLMGLPKGLNPSVPIIFTGYSGQTYAFWFGKPVDDPDGPIALYFVRWEDVGWSQVFDVVIAPETIIPEIIAGGEDAEGYLHVIWGGGALWHTKALASQAYDARSWSPIQKLYQGDRVLDVAGVMDRNGLFHIVFATAGHEIRYLRLGSEGDVPESISLRQIPGGDSWAYRPSIIVTDRGVLYASWAETSDNGVRGVQWTRSSDWGETWAEPDWAAMGHRGMYLFYFPSGGLLAKIVWGGVGVGGREIQLSFDDGETWSAPFDLTQGVGMAGYTGQVATLDSGGTLHVLVNLGDGRYVHSQYREGRWAPNVWTGWEASDWINVATVRGHRLVVVYWVPGSIMSSQLLLSTPVLSVQEPILGERITRETKDVKPTPPTYQSREIAKELNGQETPTKLSVIPINNEPKRTGTVHPLLVASLLSLGFIVLICASSIRRRHIR